MIIRPAVVVGAAATFAPTSYARARLLRQLHASGLLSEVVAARRAATDLPGDVRAGVSVDVRGSVGTD